MEPTMNVDDMTSREFQTDNQAHVDMQGDYLKDYRVIDFFRKIMSLNRHLFRDKVVLNLSCGVGILALFATKAGAKCVYAVDESNAIDYAKRIVRDNGLEDVIHLFHGKVEKIELPVKEVDIILCDWMGYSLIFQAKCYDVIYARDKWLTENGLIIPDRATLFIRGFEDAHTRRQRMDWWDRVYGFDMSAIKKSVLSEPLIRKVKKNMAITDGRAIKTINLNEDTVSNIVVTSFFCITAFDIGYLDGIFTSFLVEFSKSHVKIKLDTGHKSDDTRWMQTMFFFENAIRIQKDVGFGGTIDITPHQSNKPNLKKVDIRLELYPMEPSLVNVYNMQCHWLFKSHEFVEEKNCDSVDTANTAHTTHTAPVEQKQINDKPCQHTNALDLNISSSDKSTKFNKTSENNKIYN